MSRASGLVIAALLLVLAGCGAFGQSVSTPTPTPTRTPRPTPPPAPTATPIPPAPTPTPIVVEPPPPTVRGFRFPIEGACLSSSDNHLPNAPRGYRFGTHEGIDFYGGAACAAIGRGTPALAAKAGTVIRADWNYQPLTGEELEQLLARSQAQGYTDEEALDRFRGRQVWIDQGGGIVSRYAHLDGIGPGIDVGVFVEAGQVIGYVGNSGTPQSVSDPNAESHLHFEIRIGDSYLGAGLPPDQVRALLAQAFSP